MHLKSLEIKGFKSFADKINIEFEKGITGIVGPNGSGKSNISDAIRWVLGEQSAKVLRGAKMEDIIFSGTETRKGLGCAEVSLLIDNSDNYLPIDFDEVKVTRKLYKSGESEYLINNTQSRLKDVIELFMDTGFGKDGYSLIGQGKIDEILSSKPEDRRNVFEEAAGIIKFKTRKQESEKKLESTNQNILRISDIISEIEGQLEPLKEQSEKAKKYLSLKEELKGLEINNILRNYNAYKSKQEKIETSINELNVNKNSYLEKNKEIQNESVSIDENLKTSEELYNKINNIKYENEKKIETIQGEINLNKEKINNCMQDKDKLSKNIEEEKNNIAKYSEKYNGLITNKKNIEDTIKSLKSSIENINAESSDINKKLSDTEKEIEENKSELIEIIKNISDKGNKIESYKTNINDYTNKIQQLKNENETNLEMVSKIAENINVLNKDIEYRSSMEDEKNKLILLNTDNLKKYNSNLISLNKEREQSFSILKIHEAKYKTLNDMENNFEGYNKAVKNIIEKYKDGLHVFGTVGDIVNVERKYETAIETALSYAVQNIVVDNENTAEKMIGYLKTNHLGRATFLPITTIKGYSANIYINKLNGYIGFASELVSYDEKFKNIISSLLQRTIVCDNLENASKIAKAVSFRYRIVTLDGDIINAGGAYTGGSRNKNNLGIISRKNEISDLKLKIDSEEKTLKNIICSINDVNLSITKSQNEIKVNTEEKQKLIFEIKNIQNKIEINEHEKQNFNQDIEAAKSEIVEMSKYILSYKKNIDEFDTDLKDLNSRQQCLNDKITNLQVMQKDINTKKDAVWNKLVQKKISITESQKSLENVDSNLKLLLESKGNSGSNITKYMEMIKSAESKVKCLNEEMSEKNAAISSTNNDIHDLEIKIKNEEDKKDKLAIKNSEIKNKIISIQDSINNISETLHNYEITKSRNEVEIENQINKLWEQYEITIPQALKYKTEIHNISEMLKNISKLKEEIKSLGNINVNAIDEYKSTSERYSFLTVQKKDLENAQASLSTIIKDINKKMEEQFTEKFKEIRKYFSITFKELFGGGYADLRLNEDDPLNSGIDIIVQPPGKKLQSLSLLSGGERGLSAIALIFAIFKIKPAPFCVLDEIEAAQDDANVNRFANYLKNYTDTTQFIVITHRKGTMAICDTLYGVTMEEKGISKVISLKLNGGNKIGTN